MGMTDYALLDLLKTGQSRLGGGYRSPEGRALWAIRLLFLTGAIELIALVVELLDRRVLNASLDASQLATYQSHRDLFSLVDLAALVVTAIVFLRWLYLVHENLRELGRKDIRYGSKMAVAVWFIPVVNLWRPTQVMEDLRHTSDGENNKSSGLVVLWWLAFLASGLIDRFTSRMPLDTIHDLQTQNMLEVVSLALSVGAAVGAVFLVRSITAAQEEHAAQLAPTTDY
jgi:hypothetical protein